MTIDSPLRISPLTSSGAPEEVVGEEVKKDEENVEEEEERKPKIGRVPKSPTTQEWNDHMAHHSEYSDWCPFCVQGRGISSQHKIGDDGEKIGS